MSDYIKREDVISFLEKEYEGGWIPYNSKAILKEEIESIPTADVVERKKGKWAYERVDFSVAVSPGAYVISSPTCSVCGFHEFEATNFCPNCGADMRGEA